MFAFTIRQRALSEIDRRRADRATYTTPLMDRAKTPDDVVELKLFLLEFYQNINCNQQLLLQELTHHADTVGQFYAELVSRGNGALAREDFWQRYFYRTSNVERVMKEIQAQDLAKRQELKDNWQAVVATGRQVVQDTASKVAGQVNKAVAVSPSKSKESKQDDCNLMPTSNEEHSENSDVDVVVNFDWKTKQEDQPKLTNTAAPASSPNPSSKRDNDKSQTSARLPITASTASTKTPDTVVVDWPTPSPPRPTIKSTTSSNTDKTAMSSPAKRSGSNQLKEDPGKSSTISGTTTIETTLAHDRNDTHLHTSPNKDNKYDTQQSDASRLVEMTTTSKEKKLNQPPVSAGEQVRVQAATNNTTPAGTGGLWENIKAKLPLGDDKENNNNKPSMDHADQTHGEEIAFQEKTESTQAATTDINSNTTSSSSWGQWNPFRAVVLNVESETLSAAVPTKEKLMQKQPVKSTKPNTTSNAENSPKDSTPWWSALIPFGNHPNKTNEETEAALALARQKEERLRKENELQEQKWRQRRQNLYKAHLLLVCVLLSSVSAIFLLLGPQGSWISTVGDGLCAPVAPYRLLTSGHVVGGVAPWWWPSSNATPGGLAMIPSKQQVFDLVCGKDRVQTTLMWDGVKDGTFHLTVAILHSDRSKKKAPVVTAKHLLQTKIFPSHLHVVGKKSSSAKPEIIPAPWSKTISTK